MKKNILIILLFCVIIVLALFLWHANTNDRKAEKANVEIQVHDTVSKPIVSPYKNAKISTQIITSEGNTFGYNILIDGEILIHQSSIPCMPGNKGFRTKEQAKLVADFVAAKINNNQMPPTVTTNELDSLLKKYK